MSHIIRKVAFLNMRGENEVFQVDCGYCAAIEEIGGEIHIFARLAKQTPIEPTDTENQVVLWKKIKGNVVIEYSHDIKTLVKNGAFQRN